MLSQQGCLQLNRMILRMLNMFPFRFKNVLQSNLRLWSQNGQEKHYYSILRQIIERLQQKNCLMVCQLTPLAYYTIYCLLVYTPFIICSLVFSNDPNNAVCMNTFVQNDSLNNLNLNLWLRVYGYISSGFLVGLFIGLLLFYGTCPKAKICMVVSSIFLVVWFSLFQMTWNVIGGYIFWSGLEQTCSKLSNYLYSHFIINFIAVPVNFVVVHIFRGKNNRQQNYDVKNKASFGQADQESVPNL